MLIYLAGPYRASSVCPDEEVNIHQARKAAIWLWENGYHVITPHLNTLHFDHYTDKLSQDMILGGDCDIISRCDSVLFLPGWEESVGSGIEMQYAKDHNIPYSFWSDQNLPAVPRAEKTSPVQCEAFRNTIMQMYRVHITKNSDYSPLNILGMGEQGIITRLWDKFIRLLNLLGCPLIINETEDGWVAQIKTKSIWSPASPKHESIDDTFLDLSVYGIIGMLYRKGQWGK